MHFHGMQIMVGQEQGIKLLNLINLISGDNGLLKILKLDDSKNRDPTQNES